MVTGGFGIGAIDRRGFINVKSQEISMRQSLLKVLREYFSELGKSFIVGYVTDTLIKLRQSK